MKKKIILTVIALLLSFILVSIIALFFPIFSCYASYTYVSFGRGEGGDNNFTITKDAWTKVYFPDIPYYSIYDPGGNYDEENDYYVCPISGIYEIITRIRIRDNPTGGVQWVQGTEQLTGATALIQLTIANVRQPAISNIRISHFNAEDHIPMYVLAWGTNLIASDGYMAVKLLMPDIYTQIINTETGAEFYLDKTIDYGDVLIITFLLLFLIFSIIKGIAGFFLPKRIEPPRY